MKFTIPGKDVIRVTEDDYIEKNVVKSSTKIHLIKFDFINPTFEKIDWVLETYPDTNRFIVADNIRVYNTFLKQTNKKYYIENKEGNTLITFFKKNNKVLLNFFTLDKDTFDFVFNCCFEDVLYNTEVIYISQEMYEDKQDVINLWKGNVIIKNDYTL